MRNDSVSVPRQALFNLAFHIHTSIKLRKEDLLQTLDWEKTNPIANSVARSIDIRNNIDNLNRILDLVRECAPDDFNDFFRHYDEVCVECPF